jgi:hypothetical protein
MGGLYKNFEREQINKTYTHKLERYSRDITCLVYLLKIFIEPSHEPLGLGISPGDSESDGSVDPRRVLSGLGLPDH